MGGGGGGELAPEVSVHGSFLPDVDGFFDFPLEPVFFPGDHFPDATCEQQPERDQDF